MSMSAQDLYELVRASRTYRRFDASKPVTREEVLDLIDTARFAPTGNNTQLVRYLVVTDPDKVALLARSHGWAAALKDFNGPADASEAPSAYLALCVPAAQAGNQLRALDCGIAAQTIALAAAARSLGCCMIRSYKPEINEQLGLAEKGYAVMLLMALGRPAADERVELEPATTEHGLKYWRSDPQVHHVPKLEVDDLLL